MEFEFCQYCGSSRHVNGLHHIKLLEQYPLMLEDGTPTGETITVEEWYNVCISCIRTHDL